MKATDSSKQQIDVDVWQEIQAGRSDHAGSLYYRLLSAVGSRNLKEAAQLIKDVIEFRLWEKWRWIGNDFTAHNFLDYVTRNPPRGLGATPELIGRLIADDLKVSQAFREATTAPKHVHRDTDNISIKPKHGTSRAYTLDRLKRERADLFEQVAAGKISANEAAIEAGFRKKPVKRCPKCGHEW